MQKLWKLVDSRRSYGSRRQSVQNDKLAMFAQLAVGLLQSDLMHVISVVMLRTATVSVRQTIQCWHGHQLTANTARLQQNPLMDFKKNAHLIMSVTHPTCKC